MHNVNLVKKNGTFIENFMHSAKAIDSSMPIYHLIKAYMFDCNNGQAILMFVS